MTITGWQKTKVVIKPQRIGTKMDFSEYQEKTILTDVGCDNAHNLSPKWMYYLLGIAGETGELMEKMKKLFRDDAGQMTPERLEAVKLEMGDILWYLASLSYHLGIDFDEVAQANIDKLFSRKDRGKLHGDGDHR